MAKNAIIIDPDKSILETDYTKFSDIIFVRCRNMNAYGKDGKTNKINKCCGYVLAKTKIEKEWNIFFTENNVLRGNINEEQTLDIAYLKRIVQYNKLTDKIYTDYKDKLQ